MTLNDIITRATIEAEVYLTNSELDRITTAIKSDIQQIAKEQRDSDEKEAIKLINDLSHPQTPLITELKFPLVI